MYKYFIISLLSIFLLTRCERLSLKYNPSTDPRSIFLEYVKLVKEKYAMLQTKNISIDDLSNTILNTIDGNETDDELFLKLSKITLSLRDGHSYIENEVNIAFYRYSSPLDKITTYNKNILKNYYWSNMKIIDYGKDGYIYYGKLPNHTNVGYIFLESFKMILAPTQLEKIFSSLRDTHALIIDIRNNGGGNPSAAAKLASYLTNIKVYTGEELFKIGPGINDFSSSKIYLNTSGSRYTYLNPTYILTNKSSFSAATTFVYLTDPLPQVFTIGDTTGGGSGFTVDGFLANGWKWGLSISEFIDKKGRHLDEGINPDIFQKLDYKNPFSRVDDLIERAVQESKNAQESHE